MTAKTRNRSEVKALLCEGERLIRVDNRMPRNKEKLEARFTAGGVSEMFYGDYEWQLHASCLKMDRSPGKRAMLLKHFGRNIWSEEAIVEMDTLGYRPATHTEAYAWAKGLSRKQSQVRIVALGSFADRAGKRCVAMLGGTPTGQYILDDRWFDNEWSAECRFLFVRKELVPS